MVTVCMVTTGLQCAVSIIPHLRRFGSKLQLLVVDGDGQDDLGVRQPRPGPAAVEHLPQQDTKGVNIYCLCTQNVQASPAAGADHT